MMIGSGGMVPPPPPVSHPEETSDGMEAEVLVFSTFLIDERLFAVAIQLCSW